MTAAGVYAIVLLRRLSPGISLFTRFLEFSVSFGKDNLLPTFELVLRRHVPDRTVQSHGIAVIDVLADLAACIFQGHRHFRPDALSFQ